jgi:signal transduction histidine kinase
MKLLEMVRRPKTAPVWASVREVRRSLEGYTPMNGLVVIERLKPVGLVMRYDLDRKLASPYGYALYNERPVSLVMNRAPLMVVDSDSLEVVAARAMKRPDEQIYDEIIVVDADGLLVGVVSVRLLLEELAKVQGVLETAGAVCHELNQPLQIMTSYLDLSLRLMANSEELGTLAAPLAEQVTRITHITRRLQQMTKRETRPYLVGAAITDIEAG